MNNNSKYNINKSLIIAFYKYNFVNNAATKARTYVLIVRITFNYTTKNALYNNCKIQRLIFFWINIAIKLYKDAKSANTNKTNIYVPNVKSIIYLNLINVKNYNN